eukprot:s3238_g4.t1
MTDESQGVSSAQQWLGNPQAQDQMALLAGGMAQLQQAMLKQLSVTKDGDKSPEAVKPGVSQLPTLPPVKAVSSSIDIADWLEMLAAPMSDLSDGSASWWRQVCDQATKAYQAWTDAGPMERLTIAPPKDASLEDGRWGRVNSRAASMIVLALHENVRSEMVARRLTGSTVSLLFRLMTLYQPGGEAERSRILSNLQNPPEESEPQKAVEALRAWDRWLRRCRELSLATPDPTILSKGLTKMVEGSGENATSTPAASTNELKEVLADVGKMLKAMTAVTTIKRAEVKDDLLWARIRALSTKLGCDEEEGSGGLLDSGASHPMRVATEVEYDESIPVKVTLAGEEERVLRQNGQGTVLLRPGEAEDSQPIVPLGAVIKDLGCSLQTLNGQVASLSARLEVLQKEEKRSWNELLKDFLETGDRGLLHRVILLSPFTKDLPADVQAMMVAGFNLNGGEEYLKKLPLTRRKRRLLMASKDWMVRLFRGRDVEDDNFEKIVSRGGKVLLDVDVANSKMMDLNGAAPIYQLLSSSGQLRRARFLTSLAVHRKLHGLLP